MIMTLATEAHKLMKTRGNKCLSTFILPNCRIIYRYKCPAYLLMYQEQQSEQKIWKLT